MIKGRVGKSFSVILVEILFTAYHQSFDQMLYKEKSGVCRSPVINLSNPFIQPQLNCWMTTLSIYLPTWLGAPFCLCTQMRQTGAFHKARQTYC